jgi:hypothetical protein
MIFLLIVVLLSHYTQTASEDTSCNCFCPSLVGKVTTKVCSARECTTACSSRYPQCTNETTYICCRSYGDLLSFQSTCGSYPSNNNCDCFCDSNGFIGTWLYSRLRSTIVSRLQKLRNGSSTKLLL